PPRPWLPGHRGIDFASRPGQPVRSAGTGVVAFAGRVAGRGVVSIHHASGLRTTYEPGRAAVRAGDSVAVGAAVGIVEVGHPGCAVAACLHWGLRRGADYLDPTQLVAPRPVRLKPLAVASAPQSHSARRRADPGGPRCCEA